MSRACGISVEVDLSGIERKLGSAHVADATERVSLQVGEDSNVHCKVDTGATRASMANNSDFRQGEVRWTTPYASEAYYAEGASTRVNPNATPRWFEVAASEHLADWEDIAAEVITSD